MNANILLRNCIDAVFNGTKAFISALSMGVLLICTNAQASSIVHAELVNPAWQAASRQGDAVAVMGTDGALRLSADAGKTWRKMTVGTQPIHGAAYGVQSQQWLVLQDYKLLRIEIDKKSLHQTQAASTAVGIPLLGQWNVYALNYEPSVQSWHALACRELSQPQCVVLTAKDQKNNLALNWVAFPAPAAKWAGGGLKNGRIVIADEKQGVHTIDLNQARPIWKKIINQGTKDASIISWIYAGGSWWGLTKSSAVYRLDLQAQRGIWYELAEGLESDGQRIWTVVATDAEVAGKTPGNLVLASSDGWLAVSKQGSGLEMRRLPAEWGQISATGMHFDQRQKEWRLLTNDGRLLAADLGMNTWRSLQHWESANTHGLLDMGAGHWLVHGEGGLLAHQTPDGVWHSLSANIDRTIIGIKGMPDGNYWLYGSSGMLLKGERKAQDTMHWSRVPTGLIYSQYIQSLEPLSEKIWVAASSFSAVIRSADAGKSWQKVYQHDDGSTGNFEKIAFHPQSKVGIVVADPGWIIRSDDMGQNWKPVSEQSYNLLDAVALDTSIYPFGFLAVGKDGNIQTADVQALDWKEFQVPLDEDTQTKASIAAQSWNNIRIVGVDLWILGDGQYALVYETKDRAWRAVKFPAKVLMRDVQRLRDGSLLAVGTTGAVLASSDNGKKWQRRNIGTSANIRKIQQLPESNDLLLSGRNGTLLHSKDLGKTWGVVDSQTNKHFSGMLLLDQVKSSSVLVYGQRLLQLHVK